VRTNEQMLVAVHCKLRLSTLTKYLHSNLLECDPDGIPIYMHRADCPSFCDFACNGQHGFDCNGQHGFDIANDLRRIFPKYRRPEEEQNW